MLHGTQAHLPIAYFNGVLYVCFLIYIRSTTLSLLLLLHSDTDGLKATTTGADGHAQNQLKRRERTR